MDHELIDSIYERYCRGRFPKVNDSDIRKFELRLNIELQSEFREFIAAYNGGHFNDPVIDLRDVGRDQDRLTLLHGINAPKKFVLGRQESILLFDDNDPIQLLPIGYTIMGNLLYMLVGGDEDGFIGIKIADSDDFIHLGDDINALFERIK